MNDEELTRQAEILEPSKRAVIGLLVTSVLDPVLDHLPEPEQGQKARALWSAAWQAAISQDGARLEKLQAEIEDLDVMLAEDEPEDTTAYEADFLAALLYAIGSYRATGTEDLGWCLEQANDTLDFVVRAGAPASLGGPELDALVSEGIAELAIPVSDTQLAVLRDRFVALRDQYAPAIAAASL
ncbi:MAG: hypothetical protein FWC87_10225 [Acidimicrobiaceae bacterium]|nr:hypothetical protein [Acidimicrobiaceae bacterium]